VLDFMRVDEEVDDFGHRRWAVKMSWFFGGRACIFRRLFGREDFELAKTMLLSIWSSHSIFSFMYHVSTCVPFATHYVFWAVDECVLTRASYYSGTHAAKEKSCFQKLLQWLGAAGAFAPPLA
jgi:hypothetical protein